MAFNTIEEKLAALAECGFILNPQFGVHDLEASWGREKLDEPSFDLALVCLGMTMERPPWTPHCDTLWHFDTECIADHGDYLRIAERLIGMAGGSLKVSDLKDHVDIEGGKAWLELQHAEKIHRIDFEVEDDWVDQKIFGVFAAFLKQSNSGKVFIYYDLKGQDCIIGCSTVEQFKKLKALVPDCQLLESAASNPGEGKNPQKGLPSKLVAALRSIWRR